MRPWAGLLLGIGALCVASSAHCAARRAAGLSSGAVNPISQSIANANLLDAVFAAPPTLGSAGLGDLDFTPSTSGLPTDHPFTVTAVSGVVAPAALTLGPKDWIWRGSEAYMTDGSMISRQWPSALTVTNGRYDVDFSPQAGLGWSGVGASAEAGGMVRLGAHLQDGVLRRLHGLGVRTVDSSSFGDRGRWFLFVAASGQAVGFNLTRDSQGGLQRAGWSAEGASALISDAQAGVGWRAGMVQASVGYVHRDIRFESPTSSIGDPQTVRDSMLAFSLSIRP